MDSLIYLLRIIFINILRNIFMKFFKKYFDKYNQIMKQLSTKSENMNSLFIKK